ncbi:hypothetical protein ATZ33_13380 [Enterococcus silesiacus]|uniref:DUF1129 domain-containing protein n=1 Tax=Enterococcus silesiacus TaxID=332949 RepID=A0A0S3KDQ4_9ENTE|nr:hypothetical protein [Enterococcus silesiacus]ALS02340.1 hypothetical protein ATZ33_13380 [Enterococcus silesiacus]OJG91315.1 hypothetical protein RV15_GL000771 [Enterococcus silesiacus]
MNIKDLIKQNNELRKQLNPENKKYYEEILVYIRVNMNKDEQKTEEILLEILQDILDAQKNSTSAQAFFGKNPKEISDNILAELPNDSEKYWSKFLFVFFLILLQYNLFDLLLQPVVSINWFNTVLPVILLVVTAILGLTSIKYSAFASDKKKSYFFAFLALFLWMASILTPIIDKKMNGIVGYILFSHQAFAAILFILSICLLIVQFRFKMNNATGIYITTFFAVLEGTILLGIVNPVFVSTGLQIILWLVIVLVSILGVLRDNQKFRKN